jgi:hypothetical protein
MKSFYNGSEMANIPVEQVQQIQQMLRAGLTKDQE